MIRFPKILAALAVVLGVGGLVQAGERGFSRGSANHVAGYHGFGDFGHYHGYHRYAERPHEFYTRYNHDFGHRFSHGYFYSGRRHYHWGWSYYNPRFRTTFYYDPGFQTYYYWSAPRNAFFPISYIADAPPTDDLGPLGDPDAPPPMALVP
jgi:hypothetical protein